MIITLWTNAKSKKVSETEVSLSRQDDGEEKFKPNIVSRALVGGAMWIGIGIQRIIPKSINASLSNRFKKESLDQAEINKNPDKPSFDLIRASINLIVSSALIAYGTSQKLPLSTTFVTFMVAMGSSFADQAWGRESAVYRVAGVVNVISGWLITAVMAFLTSGAFALIMYYTGSMGMIALSGLVAFLLIRSHLVFQRKTKEEKEEKNVFENSSKNMQEVIDESKSNTIKNLRIIKKTTVLSIEALLKEEKGSITKSRKEIEKLNEQNEKLLGKLIKSVQKMDKGNLQAGRLYILVFDIMQDLYQSASLINEVCTNHIINHHSPPGKKHSAKFAELQKQLSIYIDLVENGMEKPKADNHEMIKIKHDSLLILLNENLDSLIVDIQKDDVGNRLGLLQTRILLEAKDIVSGVHRIHSVYYDFAKSSK
jgi:hypothetical protein